MHMTKPAILVLFCAVASVTILAQTEQDFLKAVSSGNQMEVNAMLEKNPALASAQDKTGISALMVAIYGQRATIVNSILAHSNRHLSLFEAAALGDDAKVREFLATDRGLAKAFSPDGFTALHLASYFGQIPTQKLLISAGSDINSYSRNALHATPLQSAAAAEKLEAARVLLAHGANPNCRGEGGYTPLHEAAASGQASLAQLLIAFKADLNARGDDGLTPLDIAITRKQAAMLAVLKNGVN